MIIQAGIRSINLYWDEEPRAKWVEDLDKSLTMLQEAGVGMLVYILIEEKSVAVTEIIEIFVSHYNCMVLGGIIHD